MQIAANAWAVRGQCRKFRQAVERDVYLSGRAAHFEIAHLFDERFRQVGFINQFQESSVDIGVGGNDPSQILVAVFKRHAGGSVAPHQDFRHRGVGHYSAAGCPK